MNKKDLNKKMIVIGITVFLSIVSVSGCIDKQKQDSLVEEDNDDSENKDNLTLTVTTSGDGSGTVDVNPIGPYKYGDIIALEAIPDDDSYFAGWSGNLTGSTNPDTITIAGNKTVDAEFVLSEINEHDMFIGTWTGNKEFEQETIWKTITMDLTKLTFKDETHVDVYITHPIRGSQSSSCSYEIDGNTLNLELERGSLSFVYSFNEEYDVLYLDETEFIKA